MKKTLALLLSAVILSGFCACSGEAETSGAETTAAAAVSNEETSESETEYRYYEHIAENDLGGKEFRIISRITDPGHDVQKYTDFGNDEIDAQEIDGSQINDVVYNRNRELEQRYNFRFKSIQIDLTPALTVRKSVLAGSDDYDAVTDGLNRMSDYSYFYNLDRFEDLDLSADCWDQNVNTSLSINNKHYVAIGDMLTLDKKGTVCTMFNKTIAKDLQLENMYDLVRAGKWTLAKFEEFIRAASIDLNGSGSMDNDDMWGYLCEDFDFGVLMLGSANRFSVKDENDYPALAMYTERAVSSYDRIFRFMSDKEVTMNMDAGYGADVIMKTFAADRGLFFNASICTALEYRYMESDFGILPIPKYDEDQQDYLTVVFTSNSGCLGIPLTCSAPEDSAFLLQAISLASTNTLQSAFHDIVLNGIMVRDEESSDMLDILFKGRVFDIAFINDWAGLIYYYSSLMKSGGNLSSSYAKLETKLTKDLNSAIESYADLD